MARKKSIVSFEEVKGLLSADPDFLKSVIRQALQDVLEAEMNEALQGAKSERCDGRLGYRSGYYGRSLITRIGKIELRVPQDRQGRLSTEVFERYQRSEKALGSVDTNFDINKKMGIFILEKNSNKGVENENTHDYRRTI